MIRKIVKDGALLIISEEGKDLIQKDTGQRFKQPARERIEGPHHEYEEAEDEQE